MPTVTAGTSAIPVPKSAWILNPLPGLAVLYSMGFCEIWPPLLNGERYQRDPQRARFLLFRVECHNDRLFFLIPILRWVASDNFILNDCMMMMMTMMIKVITSRGFSSLNKEIKILNPAPRTCRYSSRNPPFSCTRSRITRVTTLWSRSTFPTTTSACMTTETCGSSPMLTLPPTWTTPVSRSINTTLRVSISHHQLRFQSSTMIRLDLG